MKNAILYTILTAALFLASPPKQASADELGCTIILCMGAPFNPLEIPECKTAFEDFFKGGFFKKKRPNCPEASAEGYTADFKVVHFSECPSGSYHYGEKRGSEDGDKFSCLDVNTGVETGAYVERYKPPKWTGSLLLNGSPVQTHTSSE